MFGVGCFASKRAWACSRRGRHVPILKEKLWAWRVLVDLGVFLPSGRGGVLRLAFRSVYGRHSLKKKSRRLFRRGKRTKNVVGVRGFAIL